MRAPRINAVRTCISRGCRSEADVLRLADPDHRRGWVRVTPLAYLCPQCAASGHIPSWERADPHHGRCGAIPLCTCGWHTGPQPTLAGVLDAWRTHRTETPS